jgi:hypothetical protein
MTAVLFFTWAYAEELFWFVFALVAAMYGIVVNAVINMEKQLRASMSVVAPTASSQKDEEAPITVALEGAVELIPSLMLVDTSVS